MRGRAVSHIIPQIQSQLSYFLGVASRNPRPEHRKRPSVRHVKGQLPTLSQTDQQAAGVLISLSLMFSVSINQVVTLNDHVITLMLCLVELLLLGLWFITMFFTTLRCAQHYKYNVTPTTSTNNYYIYLPSYVFLHIAVLFII